MDKTIRPWLVAIDSLINYVSTLGSPFTPSTCPTLKRDKRKKKLCLDLGSDFMMYFIFLFT
jgi:hypothetical protein